MFKKKNNKATKNATALNSAATPDFVELVDTQLDDCVGGASIIEAYEVSITATGDGYSIWFENGSEKLEFARNFNGEFSADGQHFLMSFDAFSDAGLSILGCFGYCGKGHVFIGRQTG